MPDTEQRERGLTAQCSYTVQSGNRLTIHIDPYGQVTTDWQKEPSKEDKAEEPARIAEACGEAGIRLQERGE